MKKNFKRTATLLMCFALTLVLLGFTASAEELIFGDYNYVILDDGSVKITEYNGTEAAVTVPDKIDGKDVTVIGAGAFSQNSGIESLVIPGSVKAIDWNAVTFCTKLNTVTIQEGALTEIPGQAIKNCAALKTVKIPSNVTSIGTFEQCLALDNITVASGNKSLKNSGGVIYSADMKTLIKFPQGKKLAEYYIPASVTKIAENAFYEVQNPVKVYIPLTLKEIEGLPFAYSKVTLYYEGSSVPAAWKEAVDGFKFTVNGYKLKATSKITSTPGENTIKLSWSAVEGATRYRVYRKNSSGWKKIAEVTKATYTVKNVKYGTKYTFAVKAGKTSGGKTVWADAYKTYTVTGKIPATSKVTSTQSASAIKLTWTAVKGVDGYKVYQKTSSGWKALGNTTSTTYTINKLKAGTSYTFAVKAGKKVSGKVLWSGVYTTHTTVTKPAAPSKVTATQGADWIKLTWNASKGATAYRIYYKKGNDWVVAQKSITGTTYTFKGLKAGTKLTYAVKAYTKTADKTVWGGYTTYTAAVKPGNTNLKVTAASSGKVTVKWSAVPGATEYRVFYKKNSDSYKLYKTYTGAKTLEFNNFAGGDTYTFAVRAGVKTSAGVVLGSYTPQSVTVQYRTPRFLNTFKSANFCIKYTVAGETETLSFNGEKVLVDFIDEEGSQVALLYDGSWMYINHSYDIMAPLSAQTAKTLFTAKELKTLVESITVLNKYKTGKANFGGKSCMTESYTKEGVTCTYYYNGITLTGIEMKDKSGEKIVITVHNMNSKVSDQTFWAPMYDVYAPI